MKRLTRFAAVAATATVAAAGMVFGVATPASANTSPWIYTTDPAPGGKARFYDRGAGDIETLEVCDIEADGWAVYGRVQVKEPDGSWANRLTRQVGGVDNCASDAYNIPLNRAVRLKVCLVQGDTRDFCSGWWYGVNET